MLDVFDRCDVSYEVSAISAHRLPDELREYCLRKDGEGTYVFIGIAGMSAALPGVIASHLRARKPVIGVPLVSDVLDGVDALLSMVRMPSGVPVSVPGIGKSGLRNAAITACQILAQTHPQVKSALINYIDEITDEAMIGLSHEDLARLGR